jgi:glycosyltransferase involved in cell wall biosynthesis
MANILIFKFPYNSAFGGGEVHTLQLFEELGKKGHMFYLVSSCDVLDQEFKKRGWPAKKVSMGYEPVSIKGIIYFCLLSPIYFIKMSYLLLKYRYKYKTDRLYCLSMTEKILGTSVAKLLGYRVFWIEHLRIERWLLQNPLKYLYVPFSKMATTITVSNSVKKQLQDMGLDESSIKVIYNGVNTDKFKKKEKKADNKVIIGTACRLCTEKGVDYLISAFKNSLNTDKNMELWIAGNGPEEDNLKELVRKLNIEKNVKFLGFVDDINDLLNKIDIFALTPTRRESFGIAAAEASATELPVVATNISGLTEVVKDKGTGFVVRSKDVDAISKAFTKLSQSTDLREKYGKAGRERVLENFTERKMISEFEKTIC